MYNALHILQAISPSRLATYVSYIQCPTWQSLGMEYMVERRRAVGASDAIYSISSRRAIYMLLSSSALYSYHLLNDTYTEIITIYPLIILFNFNINQEHPNLPA